jgi:GH24 family phage-related lysozyme (muramidase)
MANKRREPVGYQPFRVRPLLADGLLGVAREDGSASREVAATLFGAASAFGREADRVAERQGERDGQAAALAGAPQVAFDGVATAAPDGGYYNAAFASGPWKDQAKALLRKEEGFRETPYWDVNAQRVGYGSDTTIVGGVPVKVTKGMRITRQQAEADLEYRLTSREGKQVQRQISTVWPGLPEGVKAALASVGYNYGSLPNTVVAAAKSGDLNTLASAVASLGSNPERRQREAALIRASAGGGAPAAIDQVAPAAGSPSGDVPATEAAPAGVQGGNMTVSGGGYRPTGRDTVYGRAYDKAGIAVYWSQLETEMRSTAQQAYMLHGDDPEKLEQVFTDLAREQMREHVFPEIAADYAVGYQRLTEGYMLDARKKQIARQKEADRAGFIERTNELLTTQEQQLAGLEPGSANTAEAIAGSQAAIDAHYDDAVRRGIMSEDDAATAKIAASRNAALRFYERQAEGKTPEEIRDLKKSMQEDFADGGIEGLDGAGWQTLSTRFDQMERNAESEGRQAGAALAQRGEDMANRILQGFEVDQATIGKFLLDANTAPGGQEIAQEALAKIAVAKAMRDLTLPEARAELDARRKALGDNPSDMEIRTFQFGERVLADRKQRLAADPLSYAEQQRDIEPTPMLTEAESPEAMAGIMQTRIGQADTVSDLHGVPPRYLKAGEAKAIATAVKANPEQGAQIAGAIVAGAGDRAAAVLAEFGTDAPVIAEAGTILAAGGSGAAAQDVVRGYSKDAKTKMKPAAEKQLYDREVEGALSVQSRDATRIGRAASAITRARLTDDAIDPDSAEADEIYVQALNEAAGAVYQDGVQYGGFADYSTGYFSSSRVLAPNIIKADRFDDVIGSVKNEDLDIKPLDGVARLRGLVPVAVRGGYAFHDGDPENPRYAQGEDGALFILDIEALAPKIARRMPDAWRILP